MSLNADEDRTISELEAMFIVLSKLVDKQIESGEGKGIIIAKGKQNEIRVSYTKLKHTLKKMEDYFRIKGAMSFGICKTCTHFDTGGHAQKYFGSCIQVKGRNVHEYDNCLGHSREGGGFGL